MNRQLMAVATAAVLGLSVGVARAVPVWNEGGQPFDGPPGGQANGLLKKQVKTSTIGPNGGGEKVSFCEGAGSGTAFCDGPGERNAFGNTLGVSGLVTKGPAPDMTSTPLPGAVWLFGSALVGLVALNRRRKVAT